MLDERELLRCKGHLYTIEKEKVIDLGVVPEDKEEFVSLITRYGKDFTIPMNADVKSQFPGNILDIINKQDFEMFC